METDIVRYQTRVRALMADLLVVEEHERRRLAVDLHDGLSQTIALARMKLCALRSVSLPRAIAALDEVVDLLGVADNSARSVGYELSPPVLHDEGIEPAVQWLVESIGLRYGNDIEYQSDGMEKRLDARSRVIVFRGIRELLINTAKHAQASKVSLTLKIEDHLLVATVADDGIGMNPETIAIQGSGLLSLRERVEFLGGALEVRSSIDGSLGPTGRGTTIRLQVPLSTRHNCVEAQLT